MVSRIYGVYPKTALNGDDSSRPRYIFNVRGVSYRLARTGEAA